MFKRYNLQNLHLNGYNPRDVGRHDMKKNHSYGPAVRNYWLLHYVFYGDVTFQKGDKVYNVQSGQCFIIRPDEVTIYKAKAPWYYVWIGFSAENVPTCIRSNDVLDVKFLKSIFLEIEANIDRYNGTNGDGGAREAYLCGKISEVMALLDLHYSRPKESAAESQIKKVKNYIDVRLASDLSVGDIADEFHLDRAHLSRKFKEVVGVSPQNYIVHARLREAAKLMTEHGFSPTEASVVVGYSDIYLFSKMFKKKYGVPPREYKNKGKL